MSEDKIYTFEQFSTEAARQQEKFRRAYVLRRLIGWPKIAWLLGYGKAGLYLVRGNLATELCYTIGPFNTKSQAWRVNRNYGAEYFAHTFVILLWEEPEHNQDREHRRHARPWYRVPARTK